MIVGRRYQRRKISKIKTCNTFDTSEGNEFILHFCSSNHSTKAEQGSAETFHFSLFTIGETAEIQQLVVQCGRSRVIWWAECGKKTLHPVRTSSSSMDGRSEGRERIRRDEKSGTWWRMRPSINRHRPDFGLSRIKLWTDEIPRAWRKQTPSVQSPPPTDNRDNYYHYYTTIAKMNSRSPFWMTDLFRKRLWPPFSSPPTLNCYTVKAVLPRESEHDEGRRSYTPRSLS